MNYPPNMRERSFESREQIEMEEIRLQDEKKSGQW